MTFLPDTVSLHLECFVTEYFHLLIQKICWNVSSLKYMWGFSSNENFDFFRQEWVFMNSDVKSYLQEQVLK